MAQVTVRINGYAYTVGCQDGEEEHLQAMADEVERRIESIKVAAGPSGEARMLVMASLLMADDLFEMGSALRAARQASRCAAPARPEAGAAAGKAGEASGGDCPGPGASLDCEGGAARCDRQYIPGASKHLPGNWLCRDLGLGIWCPPAHAGLWEDETPTAMAAPHISPELIEAKRAVRQRMLAAREAWDPACGARAGASTCCASAAAGGRGGVGVLADGTGDRHPAAAGGAARAGPSDRAAGDTKARQPIDLSALASGRRDAAGAFRHVAAGRRGTSAGLPAGAAAGVRPARATGWATAPATTTGRWRRCRGGSGWAWPMPRRNWTKCRPAPTTRRLDAVATERGVIFCKG